MRYVSYYVIYIYISIYRVLIHILLLHVIVIYILLPELFVHIIIAAAICSLSLLLYIIPFIATCLLLIIDDTLPELLLY